MFKTYGVTRCYYGHLHADSIRLALEGPYRGTEYRLVSADHVDFQPQRIGCEFFLNSDKFLKKQWISCMKSGRIERIQMRMVNYGLLQAAPHRRKVPQ